MVAAVETMAYAGQVPWHGLGKKVPADLTPYQMMEAAELDWEVGKEELTYLSPDGMGMTPTIVPNKFALIRMTDGKFFDIVGPSWTPLQNEKAFEFFHDFVMQGDMEMHTAGSLHDGQ